jgi:hypothetical protein
MALRTAWQGQAELVGDDGRVLARLEVALMYQPAVWLLGDVLLPSRWRILNATLIGQAARGLRSHEGQTLILRLADGCESDVTLVDESAGHLRLLRYGMRPLFNTAQS